MMLDIWQLKINLMYFPGCHALVIQDCFSFSVFFFLFLLHLFLPKNCGLIF